MERVMVYLKSLGPDIRAGRVKYFRPENPEPPTIGPTVWLEDRTDAVQ